MAENDIHISFVTTEIRRAHRRGSERAVGHARVGRRRHPDLLLGGRRIRGPPRIRQLQQVQQQLLQVGKDLLTG